VLSLDVIAEHLRGRFNTALTAGYSDLNLMAFRPRLTAVLYFSCIRFTRTPIAAMSLPEFGIDPAMMGIRHNTRNPQKPSPTMFFHLPRIVLFRP
jgi:hypothetical protein